MHAAIDAGKMYIQRGREPIDELVAGRVVPFDRRYQTVAKVQDNWILGCNAGLYSKLDDSIGAVIVSKLIESGSRNEKVEALAHVVGISHWIERQVDEANRAMWKGDYLEIAFVWLASAEVIPLQGKDEPSLG
jgi:hypothetical protein